MCSQLPTFNLALSDKKLNIIACASVTAIFYFEEAFHFGLDYWIPGGETTLTKYHREHITPALRNSPYPTESKKILSSLTAHQNGYTKWIQQAVPKQKLDYVHSKPNSPTLKAISENFELRHTKSC